MASTAPESNPQAVSSTSDPDPDSASSAKAYLSSWLNKQLMIHTTDERTFVGNFKCTDNQCNIILSSTIEYRQPDQATLDANAANAAIAAATLRKRYPPARAKAAGDAGDSNSPPVPELSEGSDSTDSNGRPAVANWKRGKKTHRFMGLIVVPGQHITKIEIG